MSTIVTPTDLGVYLGITDVDTARAQMLIDDAISQALSIVTVGTVVPNVGPTEANLPPGAASVIRAAVARIYLNPAGVTVEGAGPFHQARSAGTGALFSKAEIAQLRRDAGGGTAFSINLIPPTYELNVPPWDFNGVTIQAESAP